MSEVEDRKRGLPEQVRMRHDRHFVDNLATQNAPPVGRLVALSLIQPVPVVVAIMTTDRSLASVRSSSATARATCFWSDPADSNPT